MKKYIRYMLITMAIVTFGILYSCERQNNVEIIDTYENMNTNNSVTSSLEEYSQETMKSICIHVTGCVVNPGVYELPEGSRVYEAIVLAGGFTEEADRDYINQAAVLSDGQKVYIYSCDEAVTASGVMDTGEAFKENSRVNINTASKEMLMTLPGIGETRAESIIAYRKENGRFKAIEDIMKVSGIKDAAFNKIKQYICID